MPCLWRGKEHVSEDRILVVPSKSSPSAHSQYRKSVFTILVHVFIWFAKLRGIALNFRAWECCWACFECGGKLHYISMIAQDGFLQ